MVSEGPAVSVDPQRLRALGYTRAADAIEHSHGQAEWCAAVRDVLIDMDRTPGPPDQRFVTQTLVGVLEVLADHLRRCPGEAGG